ncbi:MAG: hypothetical protein AAGF23_01190 [Acidobacteriota bacterium]
MFRSAVILASLLTFAFFIPTLATAVEPSIAEVEAERLGLDLGPGSSPSVAASTPEALPPASEGMLTSVLLIPESTNDRVMAFDPTTGDLINADFIPSDTTNLSTPIHAILSPSGESILVSDQIEDAVHEYDFDGNHLGLFAPAGGVNTDILDNIRGMALRDNGNLLVTVANGANAGAIAEFDTGGAYLGNFIEDGAGGLDNPFDIILGVDALVSGIDSETIHRFDLAGNYVEDLTPVDSFPEQLAIASSNGNVLIANFTGADEGVVEVTTGGAAVGVYNPPSLGGYRGVYELLNGNILTTNGGGVHEIDRMGNLVETKIAGVSARFIEFVDLQPAIFADGFESGDTSAWSTTVP